MKRLAVYALMLSLLLTLTACQTVRGFGKDVQKAGSWMERKASK